MALQRGVHAGGRARARQWGKQDGHGGTIPQCTPPPPRVIAHTAPAMHARCAGRVTGAPVPQSRAIAAQRWRSAPRNRPWTPARALPEQQGEEEQQQGQQQQQGEEEEQPEAAAASADAAASGGASAPVEDTLQLPASVISRIRQNVFGFDFFVTSVENYQADGGEAKRGGVSRGTRTRAA